MNKKKIIGLIAILLVCFLYLKSNSTYTSYESEVSSDVKSEIADWNIKINDTLINGTNENGIDIDTIEWETEHTREGAASPGTSGVITITIDPTTTNVSFDYVLEIIDKTVDESKTLTVTKVESSLQTLSKEENKYKGTMLLKDISQNKKDIIKISAKWEDNGQDTVVEPGDEPTKEDFIEINFKATQKK